MSATPDPFVLYEGSLEKLTLRAFESDIDVTDTLSNGRSSYILFQKLVSIVVGLDANSEGGDSDLAGSLGKYEVKAFHDVELHPAPKYDLFHTSASSTFPPNNRGPQIKSLLADGHYSGALDICKQTGYDKNDFYIYTNTSDFVSTVPFRFLILPTKKVLQLLSSDDPRLISRKAILSQCTEVRRIAFQS